MWTPFVLAWGGKKRSSRKTTDIWYENAMTSINEDWDDSATILHISINIYKKYICYTYTTSSLHEEKNHETTDYGVKKTKLPNRKAVYCCCCTFMYFFPPHTCINVFMFIKRDIYNMFYLCNILKMDANCRSLFVFCS